MTSFYSNMYGDNSPPKTTAEPAAPVAPVAKTIPPAHQRLSGLKLTNSHMHEVEINGRYVTIPSAAYIKLLEDQIKEFRNITKNQASQITRVTSAVNRLANDLERLKATAVRHKQ